MESLALNRVVHTTVLLLLLTQNVFSQNQNTSTEVPSGEDLWETIDFISIKKSIQLETGISNLDINYYMKFLDQRFPEERSIFFSKVAKQEITQQNLQDYINSLLQKYLNTYQEFLTIKNEFISQQNQIFYKPLSFNGPCDNADFETGTTNGWQGAIGAASQNPQPTNVVNGFSPTRHQIMTTAMVDPYIPTLPVVAPGGSYSLRLENYVNGGNAAIARQTFLVTPTNNIFTYQYAAVLEDPGDHNDAERPYFKVRMYDRNGALINCATYTAIAKPPMQNFTYAKVPNPNFDPTRPVDGGNNILLDLYYRNWTTITIPLLNYIGQNVTVEFIASDCSRGGHLGYAYIDASCSYLDTTIPPTICGAENIDLYGPKNFASYLWTGPGIIGSPTTQNIQVNKSGIYKLKLTPVADLPCPITVQTIVPERCIPVPISAQACETVKGSSIKNNVNLTSYNTTITAYNTLARVFEWHSGLPATNANKIINPTNINVSNGTTFYAVINYTTAGSDTAELRFNVHSLPNLIFTDPNPLCKSTSTVNIAGASPAGGTFSGAHITSTGIFSPTITGAFPITYKYTTINGCIDSIKKSIIVNPPPTINTAATQTLCETAATVSLTATATNQTNVQWSGGLGAFLNNQNLTTDYTPTQVEKNTGSITLGITISGISPCPPVTDNITITFLPTPLVDAGIDKDICVPINSIIQLQGSSANAQQNNWSGGVGLISNVNSLQPNYQPTLAEIENGFVILTLTAIGNTLCGQVEDQMQIRFHKYPIADAGADKIVCIGANVQLTSQVLPDIIYTWESLYHTPISSTESATIVADKDSSIILKAQNQYGCIDYDTVKIDAFTPPAFNLGGPFCISDQFVINSNPILQDPLIGSPSWAKDGAIIVGANDFTYTVNQEGLYTISYTQGECEVSANASVFNNPILITPDQFIGCDQSILSLATSNIPLATYAWKKNNIIIPENSNTISTQATSTIDKYLVEVTDQHNCKAKDSVEVIGIPQPVIHFPDTSICNGTSLHMDGTPINLIELLNYPITYQWYLNNIPIGTNVNTIDISTGGSYKLVAAINTCADTAAMNVTLNPLPILNIPGVQKICPESDPSLILDAGNHTRFLWSQGETNRQISVISGGAYSVTVFNNFNCSASGNILVKEICPPRLFAADAFSPNQDGTNDLFNVYGAHIGTYQLLIFNRWGEIIFESKNKDYSWDGLYKGDLMPIGVYPWRITYEGDSQEYIGPYKLEGSVTLIK